MSHTPAPWRLECYESGTVYVHMRNASGKNGPIIVGKDCSDQDGHVGAHLFLYNVAAFKALTGETEADLKAERLANGRLIAAAPDLLEALKLAVQCLNEVSPFERDYPGWIAQVRATLQQARAAIAEAEGTVEV